MRLSQKNYDEIKARFKRKSSQSERTAKPKQVEKEKIERPHTTRSYVRIKSFRTRLLDKDNLYGGVKPVCDGLRYSGIIEDDNSNTIDLVVSQHKVKTRKEERTEIEIFKS